LTQISGSQEQHILARWTPYRAYSRFIHHSALKNLIRRIAIGGVVEKPDMQVDGKSGLGIGVME
jgi:hypothetical protein